MNLQPTESAIGLWAYHQEQPAATLYQQFYDIALEFIHKWQVVPTYFGADGDNYPDKLTKWNGRAHRQALSTRFTDTTGLSIAANPINSNKPSFDSFLNCTISYVRTSGFPTSKGGVVYFFLVINESYLPLGSEAFEQVLDRLVSLFPWHFGMGFSDTVERHPELHLACFGHNNLREEERPLLQAWYSTPPEVRIVKLRTIYPYNVLNPTQLGQEIESGLSLRAWIEQQRIGQLERLPSNNLSIWKVMDESQRQKAYSYLKERGLVVA